MSYPCLHVDLDIIRSNAATLAGLAKENGIAVTAVTKGCSALPEVARAVLDGGLNSLADARLQNIEKLRRAGIDAEFTLLRPPMRAEADMVVRLVRRSIVTHPATARNLSQAAQSLNLEHEVILMVELGDLREGVMPADLPGLAREVDAMPGLRVVGLGGNFTCICGLLPTRENLTELVGHARSLEDVLGRELDMVSAGASAAITHLVNDTMPQGVNHLRVGAALLVGFDDIRDQDLPGFRRGAFTLEAEIVEITEKPARSWGELGRNAFLEQGGCPLPEDAGFRRRALLAVGRQDVHPDHIAPLTPGLCIAGASSDHLVLDITDAAKELRMGDLLRFRPDYPGILALSTSPYVHKRAG